MLCGLLLLRALQSCALLRSSALRRAAATLRRPPSRREVNFNFLAAPPLPTMSARSRMAVICRHVNAGGGAAPFSASGGAVAGAATHTMALNSGYLMPVLGLGTFQASAPGEVKTAVKAAVNAGYRLIDCAAGYGNQAEVGEALAELFDEGSPSSLSLPKAPRVSTLRLCRHRLITAAVVAARRRSGVVRREELFVVSKLFQTHHDWEGDGSRCHAMLAQTLKELGLDYLDLYLMHWPFAFKQVKLEQPPGTPKPLRLEDGSPNPIWDIKMEYLRTWKAMESMVGASLVKSIGVSNFTTEQLTHLMGNSRIVPAVNQIELHP
jgi:diketogulonate reductase-like aldo/keto reductase